MHAVMCDVGGIHVEGVYRAILEGMRFKMVRSKMGCLPISTRSGQFLKRVLRPYGG